MEAPGNKFSAGVHQGLFYQNCIVTSGAKRPLPPGLQLHSSSCRLGQQQVRGTGDRAWRLSIAARSSKRHHPASFTNTHAMVCEIYTQLTTRLPGPQEHMQKHPPHAHRKDRLTYPTYVCMVTQTHTQITCTQVRPFPIRTTMADSIHMHV